jgi:hypothetical protein
LLVPATGLPTPTATALGNVTPTATATSTIAGSPIATITATATSTATPTPPSVISFVGGGPLADSSQRVTTVTVNLPLGVQSGDTLLTQIVVYDGSGSNVPVVPAGWTVVRHDAVSFAGVKLTSWLYFRVAGGSEPASYGWQITLQYAAGIMGAWRGASSSPIDQSSGATTAGASPISAAAPSLTPANNNELQVYFYGSQSSSAPTVVEPNAITQLSNARSKNESFTLALGDLAAPSSGTASPTYTAIASTNLSGGSVMTAQAILLKPGL